MPWTKPVDPNKPPPPIPHSPTRCMNCIHEKDVHDDAVGCTVEGGTKYIENDGVGIYACSCPEFVPAPPAEEPAGPATHEVEFNAEMPDLKGETK
jgi:hypothetical protein